MDIGRAFTYPFEDENWLKKMLIGAVLNLVPVVNLIGMGYGLRQMKKVSEGQDLPLPEWDDWGGDFVKGLLLFLATMIYTIPIWLLQGVMAIAMAIAANAGPGGGGEAVAGLCATGVTCLTVIYGLAMAVWVPAATMQYVKDGSFGAFFKFGDIWALITIKVGDYLIAWLVYLLAGIVAGVVGGIACGIGVLFTTFWSYLVMAKLFGDLIGPGEAAGPAPMEAMGGDAF